MAVRIQMKVYDHDGRRLYVDEVKLDSSLDGEDAVDWVKEECEKMRRVHHTEREGDAAIN